MTIAEQNKVLTQLGKTNFFASALKDINLYPLKPTDLEILQINLGYLCNLECNHCHVDASPRRKEITTKDVLN